jgi:hypothetical protein
VTLQEAERRRRQSEAARDNDSRVMSFRAWCELNDFSESTGRRIKEKNPDLFIQMSERRFGITVGMNRKFQAERTGKAA